MTDLPEIATFGPWWRDVFLALVIAMRFLHVSASDGQSNYDIVSDSDVHCC